MNNQTLVDEFYNVHRISQDSQELGRDSQAVVYRTTDPDIAIKLFINSDGEVINEQDAISDYADLLQKIRLLPVPEALNLSMPVACLKDRAGYVMPLLDEMVPLSWLLNGWQEINLLVRADWLLGATNDGARLLTHYSETGGLRRRLLLLFKCAAMLARLHGVGLVYGKLSLQNILVSNAPNHNEVWLIDADKLRDETPDNCSADDCFSFANLAFKLLTTEQSVERDIETGHGGLLSWINPLNDQHNRQSDIKPLEHLLTAPLRALFEQTFEFEEKWPQGKPTLERCPSIFHWPQALIDAADRCIQCPNCKMSYSYDIDGRSCPYCETPKPAIVLCTAYFLDQRHQAHRHFAVEVNIGCEINLPHRLFYDLDLQRADEALLTLSVADTEIVIKRSDTLKHAVKAAISEHDNGQFTAIGYSLGTERDALEKGLWLMVESERPCVVRCALQGVLK